jgi:hypothetical protein
VNRATPDQAAFWLIAARQNITDATDRKTNRIGRTIPKNDTREMPRVIAKNVARVGGVDRR